MAQDLKLLKIKMDKFLFLINFINQKTQFNCQIFYQCSCSLYWQIKPSIVSILNTNGVTLNLPGSAWAR